jgi:hypothetical protein
MASSKEIRWFTRTENKNITKWFAKHNMSFASIKPRVDFYLDTEKRNMGIKLREGNLEIKEKIGKGKEEKLSSNIEGVYEDWDKWSFKLSEKDELSKSILNDSSSNWIEVSKERIGIKLTRNHHNVNILMDIKEIVDYGCQIEYTKLVINDSEYFTFCFEWFGKKTIGLEQSLLKQITGNSSLDIQDSYGYPEFLGRINSFGFMASEPKKFSATMK